MIHKVRGSPCRPTSRFEGTDYELKPTGEITYQQRSNGAPLARLTAREVFMLLMFLRVPGEGQLIERIAGR